MIVYDVIQIVKPGSPTSVPVGRWWVESHDNKADSYRRAELYNEKTSIPEWVSFEVETHDEKCTGRATSATVGVKFPVKDSPCTCGGKRME